jgi:hypothetical protein
MPVILPPEALQAVPVSTWVNDVKHQGPECIQPRS